MHQSRFKSIVLIVVSILILTLGTGMIVFWAVKPASAKTRPGEDAPVIEVLPGRTNVLVMGVDLRDGDVGRSDAMVLASIDSKGKPFLLSIPRDTRTKIRGHGFDKINAAFAYGGPELAVQTVSDFLGIPINDYLVVNLDAFTKIVDVLGGVTLDVEKRMYYEDPYQDLIIDLKPGVQKLDGQHAMQYVRFRHDETGDLGRIERQQHFLTAVAKQAFAVRNLTKLPAFIRECYNAIDTDMSTTRLIKLATTGSKAYEKGLVLEMLPGEPSYVGEISYYLPNVAATRQLIADRILTDLSVATYLNQGQRQATEYEASVRLEEEAAMVADVDGPKAPEDGEEAPVPSKPGINVPTPEPSKPSNPGTVEPPNPAPNPKPIDPKQPPAGLGPKVEIFDASGYGQVAVFSQRLGTLGFRVIQAITSQQTQEISSLIIYTQDTQVVAKLKQAFPKAQVVPGGKNSNGVAATIIIGKDAR